MREASLENEGIAANQRLNRLPLLRASADERLNLLHVAVVRLRCVAYNLHSIDSTFFIIVVK
jgi:hypothetical protein